MAAVAPPVLQSSGSRDHGQMERAPLVFKCFDLRPQDLGLGGKTHPRLRFAAVVHTAQHAVSAVQIQRCIKRSLPFHGVDL